ncbi:MFS transporter, partial [Streptococcus suis]
TISQSVGFSKAEEGLMAVFFNMTAIHMSMIIPAVLSRQTKEMRLNIMLAISSVTLLGLVMMLLIPTNLILWSSLH